MGFTESIRLVFLLILTNVLLSASSAAAIEKRFNRMATFVPFGLAVGLTLNSGSLLDHDDDEDKGKGKGKDKDKDDQDDKDEDQVSHTYTIGGILDGLADGNVVVLQNNGGDDLRVRANGDFTFKSELNDQSAYEVTVKRQPRSPDQNCTVSNGLGTISGSAAGNVSVNCTTETHSLTYTAGANGRIVGTSQQTVEDESDGSEVTPMPDSGYHFSAWSDGSTDNPRRDRDVTSDINVVAGFVADANIPDTGDTDTDDDQPPAFGALTDLNINATGLLTFAPALTEPDAEDDRGSPVTVKLITDETLFRPGSHRITWAAEDGAGNIAEAIQRLDIHPLISLALDQDQPQGASASVRFLLNGQAASYPLVVGYRIGSGADSIEHKIADGTVTFAEGEVEQMVTIKIADDAIAAGMAALLVSLDDSTTTQGAANFGINRTHKINLVEDNLAPRVELAIYQSGRRTRLVAQDGGMVTVTARIADPNPGDTHTSDWLFPDGSSVTDVDENTKSVDPASLDIGLRRVEVTVYDGNPSPLAGRDSEAFIVSPSLPALGNNEDSDGDGLDDAAEGSGDADGDGQPDYLSPVAPSNVLSQNAADGNYFLIEAEPGARLELGEYALSQGADGAWLSELAGDDASVGADSVRNVGGYVDFKMRELPMAASVRVVIPQRRAVPERPVYRKYASGVWFTLIENATDQFGSAIGAEGVCPPPGSPDYRPGLTPGDWCVQLTLSDGGPNDADGEANGVIVSLGGVGASEEPGEPGDSTADPLRTSGGGGSIVAGTLLILALFGLLARRRLVRARYLSSQLSGTQVPETTVPGTRSSGHRSPKSRNITFLSLMLVGPVMLAGKPVPASAGELDTAYDPFYLTSSLGYVDTDITNVEMDSRFAAHGYTVETLSSDGNRFGWNIGVGYRMTARFALELNFIDLGDVDVTFEAPSASGALASIHPESGHGPAVSTLYRHPLTQRLGASARLGVFFREGEFATRREAARVDNSEERNKDIFYGLGVDYILSPEWSFRSEIQRFEFNHDPSHAVLIGVKFRFLEWLNPY